VRQLALKKQGVVNRILTQMLDDKKQSLPLLATLESIPRDKTLQVAVLDRTAEGLQLAARLANKPFKQVVFCFLFCLFFACFVVICWEICPY